MRRVIDRQTWFYTTFGTFFMAFGICALLLAAAGLYGVMSFAVTQRTREMGVRSALGAQGGQLIALVMRRSIIQLAIGMVLGLALALLASGALQPVLYHVDPRDRSVFAGVVVMLAVVSLVASFLPARRVQDRSGERAGGDHMTGRVTEDQTFWDEFAKYDPLWAILSDPTKAGRLWDLPRFLETGKREISLLFYQLRALGLEIERTAALDFGCGVGRLSQPLAAHFQRVVGVDVSAER